MADAGFDFTFRATNGEITVIGKTIKCADGKCVIKKRTVLSAQASRENIKQIFKMRENK
jgi:hypothetical protein